MFRKKEARFSVIKKKSIEIDKFYFTFPPGILIVDFQNFWSQNNNVKGEGELRKLEGKICFRPQC